MPSSGVTDLSQLEQCLFSYRVMIIFIGSLRYYKIAIYYYYYLSVPIIYYFMSARD